MNKIKLFMESNKGKDLAVVFIVILVGLGSFGLGRLSKENSNTGVKIEYPQAISQEASVIESIEEDQPKNQPSVRKNTVKASKPTQTQNSTGKAYFASKIGHKYYSIGCSGGKTLKAENKIYFTTEAEAVSAGYEKSSTCK